MKRKIAVVVMTLAVAFMMAGVLAKASQPTRFSQDFTMMDSCTGETINGTIDVTLQLSSTVTNGIAHINVHQKIHGTATGATSGISYIFNDEENFNQNVDVSSGAGELNRTINERIISKGSAPNKIFKLNEHMTVKADGTTTVDRLNVTDTCK